MSHQTEEIMQMFSNGKSYHTSIVSAVRDSLDRTKFIECCMKLTSHYEAVILPSRDFPMLSKLWKPTL